MIHVCIFNKIRRFTQGSKEMGDFVSTKNTSIDEMLFDLSDYENNHKPSKSFKQTEFDLTVNNNYVEKMRKTLKYLNVKTK